MRKKARLLCLALAVVLALLTGCGNQTPQAGSTLEPYELSQDQRSCWSCWGFRTQWGSSNSPDRRRRGAFHRHLRAARRPVAGHRRRADQPGGGRGALGGPGGHPEPEDYSISLRVRTEGIASSYTTDAAAPESDPQGWALQFLDEEMPVVLGEPAPVALFLYSGEGSLRTHALTDFADPAAFDGEGLALVQAVTLTFTA